MAKKIEPAKEKIEREYTIPLRKQIGKVPRYRKTEKAVKAVKEFLVRHMKIYDRDLSKIKLDKYLNELLWLRGIRNPPHQVKVRAIKEGDIVKVEAVDLPQNLKFKKIREERTEKKASEVGEKKKAEKKEEKTEEPKEGAEKEEDKEKKEEMKEKKATVIEAGKELEKAAAKQAKHQIGGKTKQPKREKRTVLQNY
jgi:large subunit ribosomal protein L31e